MELNNKEKYIKQVVENQEFTLDTHALWEAIEDRVPQEEQSNRRGFLWIFLPFLLGALAVMGIWMLTAESTLEILNKSDQVKDGLIAQNQVEKQLLTIDESYQNVEVQEDKISQSGLSNENPTNFQNTQATSQQSPANQLKEATETITAIVKNSKQLLSAQTDQTLLYQSTSGPNVNSNPLKSNTQSIVKQPQTMKLGSITRLSRSIRLFPVPQKMVDVNQPYWTKNNDVVVANDGSWKVGFYAGPSLTQSKLSIGDTYINNEFAKETNLPGFAIGVGLERSLKNNFYIRSIAGVASQVTRYENQEEIVSIGEIDGQSEVYDQGDQGSQITNASVSTQSNIDFDVRWHRIHTQYQLGLLIGRQFSVSKKMVVNLEVGANSSLLQRSTGYYLTEQDVPYTLFEKGESHPYNNAIIIDPVVGLGIDWMCSEHLSIGLYANGNVIPYARMKSNNTYQIKNFQLNTQLVVKRNLSWKK